MRALVVLAFAGAMVAATSAQACMWSKAKTADAASERQTVMTDKAAPATVKADPKG